MKKQLVYVIATFIILAQSSSLAYAKTDGMTNIAIKKYKHGNYTGCLQDCQYIVKNNPSNAIAYYYMAMSYSHAGKKDEAINAYSKVLSLKTSQMLADYARTGKTCIESPDKCSLDMSTKFTPVTQELSDIDRFVSSPSLESNSVKQDLRQKHLNELKNEINSDKEMDSYEFNKLNQAEPEYKVAQAVLTSQESNVLQSSSMEDSVGNAIKQPTNQDIANAIKTLNAAGINPYPQSNNNQAADMAQINMLMGNNQSQPNNSMMNMLPYMLTQNKNGENNNVSPQVMQAIIMNSMMSDFNYNLEDKNNN